MTMTRTAAVTVAAILCALPASARPDLRQPRLTGLITVYPDDARRNVFYYAPGDLAIAADEQGQPAIHLLHARYTGSAATGDRGATMVRSILTLRVVLSGPTSVELAAARQSLVEAVGGAIELRPLPIRRVESVVVYTPVSADTAAAAEERPLRSGHFEEPEPAGGAQGKPRPKEGFWTERVYTLGLGPADAQLLSEAFDRGRLALSLGYAFLSDGIGPDKPLQELTGSPAVVSELTTLIEPKKTNEADEHRGPYVVRAGAIGVTVDTQRFPQIIKRVDINESAPPGYAALDVHCYDFSQGGESSLYEKQIEIDAAGVGGGRVKVTATFSRAQPELVARSLRFPVAVRLDRPYRFRILETAQDGTSKTTPWQEQPSWTALLDITAQGGER